MKKLLFVLAAVIFAASCKSGESVLFASKTQINSECPTVIDEITTLKNVVYGIGDPVFIYNYTIDETKCPMSLIKEQIEVLAEQIKSGMDHPDMQAFLDACKKANVYVLYQYSGSESGEMCWISYYPNSKEVKIKRE